MIKIDFTNLTSQKIGRKHGISEKKIKQLTKKNSRLQKEVFSNKNKSGYAFLSLPDNISLIRKIKKYATEQNKNKWENIVVLGIGGSALGAIAVRDAILGLCPMCNKPRLFVIDNIDPAVTSLILSKIDFKKSLFVVISRSGTTTEPMMLYGIIKEQLKKKVKNIKKHFVFITDPKSGLLRKIGKKENIKMFDIPSKIGGRFSVLSSVGLVPLALAGIDIAKLLKGAREMRDLIKKDDIALKLAISQFILDRKKDKSMTVWRLAPLCVLDALFWAEPPKPNMSPRTSPRSPKSN